MGSPQIDPAVRFFTIKSIFLYTFICVRPTQLLALLFKNDGTIGGKLSILSMIVLLMLVIINMFARHFAPFLLMLMTVMYVDKSDDYWLNEG